MALLNCQDGLTGQNIIDAVNENTLSLGNDNPVILTALDSLTAGAGGFTYMTPLEKMARGVVGWGGRWVPLIGGEPTGSEAPVGFLSGVANVSQLDQTDYRWLMSLAGEGAYSDTIGARFTYEIAPEFDWVEAEVYYLQQPGGGTITLDYPTNLLVSPSVSTDGVLSIQSLSIQRLAKGVSIEDLSLRVNNFALDGKVCVYGVVFKSGDSGPIWINSATGGQLTETYIKRTGSNQVDWYQKLGVNKALINGGMNDRTTRTPVEFQLDLTELCSRIQTANANAEITVIRPNEPSDGLLTQYDNVYIDVADDFGGYLDFRSGTYLEMDAAGLMLDSVHPNQSYQWLMAQKACKHLFGRGRYVETPALIDYVTE